MRCRSQQRHDSAEHEHDSHPRLAFVIRNFRDKALVPARSKTYDRASSVTVLKYRAHHHHCGISSASFVTGAGNRDSALRVPASAIQRASFISTKVLAHLFHSSARERSFVPLFVARRQRRMKSSLKRLKGGSINVFISRTENRTLRRSKASGRLDWRREE